MSTRGAHPIAVLRDLHGKVSTLIGPHHTSAAVFEQSHRGCCRVPVIVGLTDADERQARLPHLESLGGKPVDAAVMRDLEHVHRPQSAVVGHTAPHRLFGVTGEQRGEPTSTEFQHDTGVVDRKGAIRPARPNHTQTCRAHNDGVACAEGLRHRRALQTAEQAGDVRRT